MKTITTDKTAANIVTGSPAYTAGSYTLTGLVVGRSYLWTKGANDTACVVNGSISLTATGVFTATATSVTLTGSGSSSITAKVSLMLTAFVFQGAAFTPSIGVRQVTCAEFPSSNLNWSRQHQISEEAHFVKRGTTAVAMTLADFSNLGLALEVGLTWTPPVIQDAPAAATATGTAAATGTLTNDTTNVADGATVTIGSKVYTLQSTLTNVDGNVKIGASATATMTNLFHAINGTGGTSGTDYAAATVAHPLVTATNPTAATVAITAITSGVGGNAIVTTETSTHLAWGASTMTGGTVSPATFTIVGGSEYNMTYQWQYSADGTTGWTNCSGTVNGCAYTNPTTATLTCTPTTTGQTGYYHRCTITDDATAPGSVTSDAVTLTIT